MSVGNEDDSGDIGFSVSQSIYSITERLCVSSTFLLPHGKSIGAQIQNKVDAMGSKRVSSNAGKGRKSAPTTKAARVRKVAEGKRTSKSITAVAASPTKKVSRSKTGKVASKKTKSAAVVERSRKTEQKGAKSSPKHSKPAVKAAGKNQGKVTTAKSQAGSASQGSSKSVKRSASAPTIKTNATPPRGHLAVSRTRVGDSTERRNVSSIPAPTAEVLKPFREAAKVTRKLQKERIKASKSRGDFIAKQNKKGKKYKIDLRVHTPGSYGFFSTGGVDPAPALVRLAKVKGLDMIAVTDYYNASYIDKVREHASGSKIVVLPGFDMCCRVGSCDGITAIALFPPSFGSTEIQTVLNELNVPPSAYGRPDYVIELAFDKILSIVEGYGGIIIPSRIDKTPFRKLAIPTLVEHFGFHAFDLVHCENPEYFRENWPSGGFTFFSFSNANALGQVGTRSATVRLNNLDFDSLKELVARRTCHETAIGQNKAPTAMQVQE